MNEKHISSIKNRGIGRTRISRMTRILTDFDEKNDISDTNGMGT